MNVTPHDRRLRIAHWLTAGLLLLLFGLGLSMTRFIESDDWKLRVYAWHEWTGLTVFALAALRLWFRMRDTAPPMGLPPLEGLVARAVYAAMYAVLFIQPIVGWMLTSAFGFQVVYLGLVPLPPIVAEDREFAERLQYVHRELAVVLAILFAAHMGGVLMHHLVKRDGVMRRMWPD